MKPIKSTDPRKKAIVAFMKLVTGCAKITSVAEDKTHYWGNACWPKRPDAVNGPVRIPKMQLKEGTAQ